MEFNEKYFDGLFSKNRSEEPNSDMSELIGHMWLDHAFEVVESDYRGFEDLKMFESFMYSKISDVEDNQERENSVSFLRLIVTSVTSNRKQLQRVIKIRRIFFDQEESYETPRFGSLMEEFVTERVPEISNGEKSYYDFVVSLYEVCDSQIHDLLSVLDNHLENYSSVRNEHEEDGWDQVFEIKFSTLLDLIDQNR